MKKTAVEEEIENEELTERGFEFFKHPELPAGARAIHAHIHSAIEFIYVTDGSLTAFIDGVELHAEAGDLLLFRSRGIHSIYAESCELNRYYVLKFKPKLIQDISPKRLAGKLAFRFSVCNPSLKCLWKKDELFGTEILSGINKLINELSNPGLFPDVAMMIYAASVMLGVLRSGDDDFDKLSPATDKIYESIIYVNQHFDEDITAESVGEKMNMSYSYFSRSFKKATGKNFKDYLNIARTNRAQQLLINTDLTVTDIALKCGYNNISYFISLYKRYKGKTPLAERK